MTAISIPANQRVDLGHGRGWLLPQPAASLLRVDAQLGRPLQITSAGRTVEDQLAQIAQVGLGVAVAPEYSWHVKGLAIDSDDAKSPSILAILKDNGWTIDTWEWWHLQYHPQIDNHINDSVIPTIPKGLDMSALRIISCPAWEASNQRVLHNGQACATYPAGWLEMLAENGVEQHIYANNSDMLAEVNLVWQLGGLDANLIAEKLKELSSTVPGIHIN
jgi:hypothetical protein